MDRVALLNVKYSPNLGDGVIAECLEHEFSRLNPDWEITSIDLAGRDGFGSGPAKARAHALRILTSLPSPIRVVVASAALRALIHFKYRTRWRSKMQGVSAMILGGGQIIADADLNFPLKIAAILQELRRLDAAFAIFGVGVAAQLSPPAKRLLGKSIQSLQPVHVAIRDGASIDSWNRHFSNFALPDALPCRDPGLIARDVYPKPHVREGASAPIVGVGIVDPRTLSLHSGKTGVQSFDEARRFWVELCQELAEMGYRVTLFTNGPVDDEEFLESVEAELHGATIQRAPRPMLPRELADTVSGMDAIIAHRLHANILAYSFRVPHVGLSWDPKVAAFFGSVGRSRFVANSSSQKPAHVAALVAEAIDEGIDNASHAAVLTETKAAIARCASNLSFYSDNSQCVATSQIEDPLRV